MGQFFEFLDVFSVGLGIFEVDYRSFLSLLLEPISSVGAKNLQNTFLGVVKLFFKIIVYELGFKRSAP